MGKTKTMIDTENHFFKSFPFIQINCYAKQQQKIPYCAYTRLVVS